MTPQKRMQSGIIIKTEEQIEGIRRSNQRAHVLVGGGTGRE